MNKTQTTASTQPGSEQILANARESARKLWFFGLGAYSLASKTGAQAFDVLVREGKAFRPKAGRQIKETTAELMSNASESLDRGEALFRNRLLRPLNRVVLASKRDVEQLSARLGQLTAEVRKLTSAQETPASRKTATGPAEKANAKAAGEPLPAEEAPNVALAS